MYRYIHINAVVQTVRKRTGSIYSIECGFIEIVAGTRYDAGAHEISVRIKCYINCNHALLTETLQAADVALRELLGPLVDVVLELRKVRHRVRARRLRLLDEAEQDADVVRGLRPEGVRHELPLLLVFADLPPDEVDSLVCHLSVLWVAVLERQLLA